MKKLLIAVLAAVGAYGVGQAAPVTAERAKATATQFMHQLTGAEVTVKQIVASTDDYYVVNLNPTGWVVVSADDVAIPVVGYNPEGEMSWASIPQPMQQILFDLGDQVRQAKRQNFTSQNKAWASMTRPGGIRKASAYSRADDDNGIIGPLIPVKWNQSRPFNKYCPGTGSNQALVGCPAVSLAQALTVQRYPSQPQGEVIYACPNYGELSINYDQEPPYDWDKIISGANNYDLAAKLLYHCGVAVNVDYGVDGTGVPSNRIDLWVTALTTTFGYNKADIKSQWRSNYRGDWETLVLNELEAGRAVIYNAIDRQGGYGHSFNIDGYDPSLDMFYVNWGWGGSGNGYFSLDALRDSSMGMNYDSSHCLIYGIGSPNSALRSIELSDYIIDEGLPAGTAVGEFYINGEPVPAGAQLDIMSTGTTLPFEIKDGLLLTTGTLTAQEKPYEVKVRVSYDGATLASVFSIQVCKLRSLGQATSMIYDRNTGVFTVSTRANTKFTLTGKDGAVKKQGDLFPLPHAEFNMSDLDAGENVITITSGNESKTIKVVK